MANRTVQLLGQGYGSNPAEITVTANGNTVFTGAVPTLNQPVHGLPDPSFNSQTVVLCSFDIDQSFTGQLPMTYTVNSGTVIFAQLQANYSYMKNPIYTPTQLELIVGTNTPIADKVAIFTPLANPPLAQSEIDELLDPNLSLRRYKEILAAHNIGPGVPSGASGFGPFADPDPRTNVFINGVEQNPDRSGFPGTWFWTLSSGSTMTCDVRIDPAIV